MPGELISKLSLLFFSGILRMQGQLMTIVGKKLEEIKRMVVCKVEKLGDPKIRLLEK